MPSFVWNYFIKLTDFKARCQVKGCRQEMSYQYGTKAIIYHLKHSHNIVDQTAAKRPAHADEKVGTSQAVAETTSQITFQVQKRQKTLDEYCTNKSTLDKEIAQMVAKSNFTFNQIAQSKFIRESLASKYPGQIIPKDNHTVAARMMNFYDTAFEDTKQRIQRMKDDGKKFSATLDEWTSSANARYININVHFTVSPDMKTSHINLGFVRIEGRCPAESQVELLRKIFFSFRKDR